MENPWDQIAEHRHYQLVSGEDHTFNELLLPQLNEILRDLDNIIDYKVIDIGCGTGFLTEILSHQVKRIVGIDPSQKSISIAKDYVKDIQNAWVECVSIEDFAQHHREEFDLAIAHMTLQAIEDLDKAISGISNTLKTNGWFIFSIPHPCFWHNIKSKVGDDNFHYHIPSIHENTFRFSEDLQFEVPYFHRSLDSYCSTLRSYDLSIIDIYEPFPDETLMKKYLRPWFAPGFMFVLSKKIQIGGSR